MGKMQSDIDSHQQIEIAELREVSYYGTMMFSLHILRDDFEVKLIEYYNIFAPG